MTGGGFGGCAVALVEKSITPSFVDQVTASYQEKTGLQPHVFICRPTNGAELIKG
jgi:galactokinase